MTGTKDACRSEFERITESLYEGNFATYECGDYVNEIQQYQWEGFHDGWKAALKRPEVTMNYLLAILDKATVAKGGVMTWEEGLRAIRTVCNITAKETT